MLRRRAILVCAVVARSCARGPRKLRRRRLDAAGRRPERRPVGPAALAVDLRRAPRVCAEPVAVARPRLEREAAGHVRGARAARRRIPPAHRGARDGRARSGRSGTGPLLRGYGDPMLDGRRARAPRAHWRAGIRRVTGAVVGDESWYDARRVAPGWKPRSTPSRPALGALLRPRRLPTEASRARRCGGGVLPRAADGRGHHGRRDDARRRRCSRRAARACRGRGRSTRSCARWNARATTSGRDGR